MSDSERVLTAQKQREIERFLDGKRVEHDIPGLSIAITDRDNLLYENAFGARDIENNIPVTPETLYSIASVTKVYTALAILRLATTDQLSVTDEIREYTDVWTDVPGDPITIADLLAHTSGVPDDHGEGRWPIFGDALPTSPMVTFEDTRIHANAAADRRIVNPDYPMYSNRGYEILGDIVETVSGRSYKRYVEEQLFAPLGMDESQVGYGDLVEMDGDVAHGYEIADGEPILTEHNLQQEVPPPHSFGGILSSVVEMAKTAQFLLNEGTIDGEQLVDADLIAAMFEVQSPTLDPIEGGYDVGYGYGPSVWEFLDDTLAHHGGNIPGFQAYLGVLREAGVGVTLAVNTSAATIGPIGQGVFAILNGADPVAVVPKLGLAAKCRAVAGTYEGFRGSARFTVEPSTDESHITLTPEGTDGPGMPALPNSTDPDDLTFYKQTSEGHRLPISFHETPDGLELRFRQYRGRRVP